MKFKTVILAAAGMFIVLELFFRFVIPVGDQPTNRFDPVDTVLHFDTNYTRDGFATFSCRAYRWGRWHINNYGWNSSVDYDTTEYRRKPVIAVIGDSYVYAEQVDCDKSYPALLREKLAGEAAVYSFGSDNIPLSQYLQISRYCRRLFKPDVLIVNVSNGDFSGSIATLHPRPSLKQITPVADSFAETTIIPFRCRNPWFSWMRISAFIRYLTFNLRIQSIDLHGVPDPFGDGEDSGLPDSLRSEVEGGMHYLIAKFRAENQGTTIIFMVDGRRGEIYEGFTGGSPLKWTTDMIAVECAENGIGFSDLQSVFADDYTRNHRRFDNGYDYHWDKYGHRVVADALYRYIQTHNVLPAADSTATTDR